MHEYGTPEYHTLISPETRRPGSRAAIVIDVYQVSTVNTACSFISVSISPALSPCRAAWQSCGFAVPLYNFVIHRTQLLRFMALQEKAERDNALLRDKTGCQMDPPKNSLRAYWLRKNMKSLDGLPGLLTAPDAIVDDIPQNNFDKDAQRPTLDVVRGNNKDRHGKDREKALALGFVVGAITATAFTQILGKMNSR